MATIILDDAFVEVDGTDISSNVTQVALDLGRETVDPTAMGDNTRLSKAALKTWSVSLTVNQDFSSSAIDSTLFPLYDNGTEFTVRIRPTSDAVGTSNPEYSGTAFISSYPPFGASTGDLVQPSIEMEPAGDMTRSTS